MRNVWMQCLSRRSPAVILALLLLAGCGVTPGTQSGTRSGSDGGPPLACSTQGDAPPPDSSLYRDHLLVADDRGRLAYSGDQLANIEQMLSRSWAQGRRSVLVYVHGGLNTEAAMVKNVLLGQLVQAMEADGHMPLLLLWRTGGLETWWEQSSRVRGGYRFERAVWDTPIYIASDLVQAVARAPVTYLKQLGRVGERYQNDESQGWLLHNEAARYRRAAPVGAANNVVFHDHVDDEHDQPFKNLSYTATFPARFVSSPFVDGLGRTAWENMVRRARTTVHQTAEFDPACLAQKTPISEEMKAYPDGTGAFAKLFAHLKGWQKANDPGGEMRITLIGHSMGAIVLNELVRVFPDLPYHDIVYMGAAASIADFNRSIVPQLRDEAKDVRFYNLMLHPRAEAWELSFGGAVPSGSLLEWIDEMYEPPRTMLDRTLGKWRNVKVARHIWPDKAAARSVFKVFGYGEGEPGAHGDFNNVAMCFWNPTFWTQEDFDWAGWGRPRPRSMAECYRNLEAKPFEKRML